MRAKVTPLYEYGIAVPRSHLIEYEGVFGMDTFDHNISKAFLYREDLRNAREIIPDLNNAVVVGIYRDHIKIRGYVELYNDKQDVFAHYYNEWIVKLLLDKY